MIDAKQSQQSCLNVKRVLFGDSNTAGPIVEAVANDVANWLQVSEGSDCCATLDSTAESIQKFLEKCCQTKDTSNIQLISYLVGNDGLEALFSGNECQVQVKRSSQKSPKRTFTIVQSEQGSDSVSSSFTVTQDVRPQQPSFIVTPNTLEADVTVRPSNQSEDPLERVLLYINHFASYKDAVGIIEKEWRMFSSSDMAVRIMFTELFNQYPGTTENYKRIRKKYADSCPEAVRDSLRCEVYRAIYTLSYVRDWREKEWLEVERGRLYDDHLLERLSSSYNYYYEMSFKPDTSTVDRFCQVLRSVLPRYNQHVQSDILVRHFYNASRTLGLNSACPGTQAAYFTALHIAEIPEHCGNYHSYPERADWIYEKLTIGFVDDQDKYQSCMCKDANAIMSKTSCTNWYEAENYDYRLCLIYLAMNKIDLKLDHDQIYRIQKHLIECDVEDKLSHTKIFNVLNGYDR